MTSTITDSFGDRGQVIRTELEHEPEFSDNSSDWVQEEEYDERGRRSRTVREYAEGPDEARFFVREFKYIDDTELLDIERELRGPSLEGLVETQRTTHTYDENDNLVVEDRSADAHSGSGRSTAKRVTHAAIRPS